MEEVEIDYILHSFHPDFVDVQRLEKKFKEFCSRKYQVEMLTTQKRLKYAPYHSKVVHKIFGRESSTSKVLLYHDEDTYKDYMKLITRNKTNPQMKNNKDRVVQASVLTGVVSDAKSLVMSVRSDAHLYLDVLTLFELVNMTYFCKDDYICNTHPGRRWIVEYLCETVSNITSHKCGFDFSVDSQGLQTETLLKEVRSILLSCTPPMKRPINIAVKKRGHYTPLLLHIPEPLSSSYYAHHSRLKGRTIIGRNETRHKIPTTYSSPISNTIAKPMPDTLLPACTGSMLTRMEDTDL
jgi:hypothetical protein